MGRFLLFFDGFLTGVGKLLAKSVQTGSGSDRFWFRPVPVHTGSVQVIPVRFATFLKTVATTSAYLTSLGIVFCPHISQKTVGYGQALRELGCISCIMARRLASIEFTLLDFRESLASFSRSKLRKLTWKGHT